MNICNKEMKYNPTMRIELKNNTVCLLKDFCFCIKALHIYFVTTPFLHQFVIPFCVIMDYCV